MTEHYHRHISDTLTFTSCPDGLCFWPQTLQKNLCFLTNQHTFNSQLVTKRDQQGEKEVKIYAPNESNSAENKPILGKVQYHHCYVHFNALTQHTSH